MLMTNGIFLAMCQSASQQHPGAAQWAGSATPSLEAISLCQVLDPRAKPAVAALTSFDSESGASALSTDRVGPVAPAPTFSRARQRARDGRQRDRAIAKDRTSGRTHH